MNQYPPKADEYPAGAPPPYNNYGAQQNVGFSNPSGFNDPEDPFSRPSTFSDVAIRHAFIKKVYGILTLQLSVTIGFIALFISVEAIQKFFQANSWILWVVFALTIVIIIVLACCNSVARKYPLNIILLFAFTILESILLGVIAATYKLEEVLIAAGITAVVVVGITIFAFQTKIDFTGCGIYLFVGCLVLLGFGLVCGILGATGAFSNQSFKIVNIVYSALGAALFSMYLVFDTQLMMGGKHKYSISPEDYIMAALNLYLDIINLFLYILRIVGAAKN